MKETLGPSLEEIVINELAFRSLNSVPHEPPATTAEAIDSMNHWLRLTGLGITAALYQIAQAIREHTEQVNSDET